MASRLRQEGYDAATATGSEGSRQPVAGLLPESDAARRHRLLQHLCQGRPEAQEKSRRRRNAQAAQPALDATGVDPLKDPTKLIYQASITDVTRDCSRANGSLTMKIAVAGKVVPGPMFSPGAVSMPIRVAVMHGTEVLYSQLHQYQVQVTDPSTATQFVFTDSNVVVPEPTARDYQAFAGYDEGAPKKTTDKKKVAAVE